MKNNAKKIIFAFAGIFCVVAVIVSAYFLFFRNNLSDECIDQADDVLVDVYVPKSSPVETIGDTVSGFVSSMRIYELDAAEKQEVEADILSNVNWKNYLEADSEIVESLTLIMLTTEFEPDLENCYVAFYNYNENYPDLPLSSELNENGNVLTFSSRQIAVYDKANSRYYLIDSIS